MTQVTTPRRHSPDVPNSAVVGSDFARLARSIRAAGLLERRLAHYAVRTALSVGAYVAVVVSIALVGDSWWQLLNAALLAAAFTQVAFLGHDAGHHAVFATRRCNDAFGRAMGALIGLSYGWWLDTHNRHHANPNQEDSDPDIGDGVLAFTAAQAARRNNPLSRFVVRRQAWLFFPLTLLEGISLHVDSAAALITGRDRSHRGGSRRAEALTLILFAAALLTLLLVVMSPVKAAACLAVNQALWGLYMSCVFAPAHKGMPIIDRDARLDFLRKQVLTSRDIRGGTLTDLVLGGLNYQIEHHLFPNMPRPCQRHAQPIIRDHCASLGLVFHETTLINSYRLVLRHLNSLGAPLRDAPLQPAPNDARQAA